MRASCLQMSASLPSLVVMQCKSRITFVSVSTSSVALRSCTSYLVLLQYDRLAGGCSKYVASTAPIGRYNAAVPIVAVAFGTPPSQFYRMTDIRWTHDGDRPVQADFPAYLQHLCQQVNRHLIGLVEVNSETVERYHRCISEPAARSGAAGWSQS